MITTTEVEAITDAVGIVLKEELDKLRLENSELRTTATELKYQRDRDQKECAELRRMADVFEIKLTELTGQCETDPDFVPTPICPICLGSNVGVMVDRVRTTSGSHYPGC